VPRPPRQQRDHRTRRARRRPHPRATIGALLLGPGTKVSHQAITLLAESGSTAVWVGEQGVRYYAHGRSLASSTRLLEAQVVLVSNRPHPDPPDADLESQVSKRAPRARGGDP
jgi:hypothetical protein